MFLPKELPDNLVISEPSPIEENGCLLIIVRGLLRRQ